MNHNDLLFFFPLYGITIEDTNPTHTFIFNDATIMSAWEVAEFARGVSEFFSPHSKLDAHSYLVVRVQNTGNSLKLRQDAESRANEIVAAISIIILAYSDFCEAPARDKELSSSETSTVFCIATSGSVNIIQRHYGMQDEYTIFMPEPPISYTREKLEVLLLTGECSDFAFMLLRKNDSPFRKKISAAATFFYTTFNVSHPSTQLAGAVTVMEILFKIEFERDYKVFKKRVRCFMSNRACDIYSLDKIFEIRRKIVHDGEVLCSIEHIRNAIEFTAYLLFTYSDVAQNFQSIEDLLSFVDRMRESNHQNTQIQYPEKGLTKKIYIPFIPKVVRFYGLTEQSNNQKQDSSKYLHNLALAICTLVTKLPCSQQLAIAYILSFTFYKPHKIFLSLSGQQIEDYICQYQKQLTQEAKENLPLIL